MAYQNKVALYFYKKFSNKSLDQHFVIDNFNDKTLCHLQKYIFQRIVLTLNLSFRPISQY